MGTDPMNGQAITPTEATPLGLYEVHWKSGGTSLASVYMDPSGERWIAPTNWVRPGPLLGNEWADIYRLVPIHAPTPSEALPEVEQMVDDLIEAITERETACHFGGPAKYREAFDNANRVRAHVIATLSREGDG